MTGFNLLGINAHSEDKHFKSDSSINAILAGASENMNSFKEVEEQLNALKQQLVQEVAYDDSQLRLLIASKQDLGNYLTEHQSLTNYAKLEDVEKAISEHSHSEYLTEDQISTKISEALNSALDGDGNYDSFKEISKWINTHGETASSIIEAVNAHTNEITSLQNAGFITEHQSLEGLAKISDVERADAKCSARTENLEAREENDVVYLRKIISDLAGRVALVELKQDSTSTQQVVSSAAEVSQIANPSETSLVIAGNDALESFTGNTVYKDIAVVNSYADKTIKLNASDKVTIEGMTIDGKKDAGNGKINYSTPELEIKNAVVEHTATAYNIFEGEQSTAENARNTEKITIDNITVDSPEVKHNILNVYTPTNGAEITVKNSYFNVNMNTTNLVRISNYLDSENVTITFDNVDWTYENVPYTASSIPWAGLILVQASKNTADSALNRDFSKLQTWKIIVKNCRYNGIKITSENCKYGNANQIGYFYSDSVKNSEDLATIIPIEFK